MGLLTADTCKGALLSSPNTWKAPFGLGVCDELVTVGFALWLTPFHAKTCGLHVYSAVSWLFVGLHLGASEFVQCTHQDAGQIRSLFKPKQEINIARCQASDLSSRVFEESFVSLTCNMQIGLPPSVMLRCVAVTGIWPVNGLEAVNNNKHAQTRQTTLMLVCFLIKL